MACHAKALDFISQLALDPHSGESPESPNTTPRTKGST